MLLNYINVKETKKQLVNLLVWKIFEEFLILSFHFPQLETEGKDMEDSLDYPLGKA